MAKSEWIYVDLATVGATPSAKYNKSGPGMGKSKAHKGSKLKSKGTKGKPTSIKKPSKGKGKGGKG